MKNIDFAIESTFDEFQKVAFQFGNAPRTSLLKTPQEHLSVYLGGSVSPPILTRSVLSPARSKNGAISKAPLHEYVEASIRDDRRIKSTLNPHSYQKSTHIPIIILSKSKSKSESKSKPKSLLC